MENQVVLPHEIRDHWKIIQDSLCNVHWTPQNLIQAIDKIYKSSLGNRKDLSKIPQFSGLLQFIGDPYHKAGNQDLFWGDYYFGHHKPDSNIKGWFLAHTVPYIVQLILNIPQAFPSGLEMVNTDDTRAVQEIIISKHQSVTLLACSFFCAFHHSAAPAKKTVNFDKMYLSLNKHCPQNVAKLCMMMNYFERCRLKMFNQIEPIVIKRLNSSALETFSKSDWSECGVSLSSFQVDSDGSIDDSGCEVLHVDFANRWIGGGVLNRGAVQEEIMFSKCPELLTTVIICGVMENNEAIVITGADEFSLHKGYGKTFKFIGNAPPSDGTISRVAMDATRFTGDKNPLRQYSEENMVRELNKARVAFNHDHPSPCAPVATGNWGCGAFAGHVQLKSMLQWLAASSCSKPIIYYSFHDENCEGLEEITKFLLQKGLKVGELYNTIKSFADQLETNDTPKGHLFTFLKESLE